MLLIQLFTSIKKLFYQSKDRLQICKQEVELVDILRWLEDMYRSLNLGLITSKNRLPIPACILEFQNRGWKLECCHLTIPSFIYISGLLLQCTSIEPLLLIVQGMHKLFRQF